MLRRVSVHDVQSGRVSRKDAFLAVVMRFYPRGVRKELIDEYIRPLAPPGELFTEFKAQNRTLANHNSAFYVVNYEARFDLSEEGRERLRELSELSRKRDVALVCQCRDYDRCHCDLLLLWAKKRFGAPVRGLIFDYPVFQARLDAGEF